ncbi:flavodoxin [Clostridium sp. D33t1_170424_F3]|uniref:flavodoxin n=1 Tax=Clostridium sp. D33t1_170424_F3 TaxID=2787099 RepID=UPI0018AB018A|nr:flavodoxin [Clostridium sp. D33t1_170424_F3]
MKTLLLYYSYGGNTRSIARRIQAALGCDMAEIETAAPYSGDYNAVVEQGQQEVNTGFEPELKPLAHNIAGYDAVILGTPVWWYTFAPAVKTVLSMADWTGKTVYPFATNGGWIGHTFQDFEKACAGATVKKGMDIRFDGRSLRTSETDVDRWIQTLKEENQ